MAEFDLAGARQAGYTDAEIANSLGSKMGFDVEGARKAGYTDADIVGSLTSKFSSTGGGAATGNPTIQAQGSKALKPDTLSDNPLAAIGGAAGFGAVAGAAAPEILSGLAAGTRAIPQLAPLSTGLEFASNAARAAGRLPTALTGAISGAASETAGQIAEGAGASQPVAEALRFAAGGIGGETVNAAKTVLQKYALTPALGLISKFKHEGAKALLDKLNSGAKSLSQKEQELLDSIVTDIRGGEKTDVPLENVGSLMGQRGQTLLNEADRNLITANQNMARLQFKPGMDNQELGTLLRDKINSNMAGQLETRSSQYKTTQAARDRIVNQQEQSGNYISDKQGYKQLVSDLQSELDNSVAMKRSPEVQGAIQKVLNSLQNKETTEPTKTLVLKGQNLDFQETPGIQKPTTFQAVDDLRRKLGDVFKGKPAEGYEALNDARGRELYARLTELQKNYAGGENGPHAKLLQDYHNSSEELAQFRTKLGKKATALDQYQEGKFSTDTQDLPNQFFKSKDSFRALKELTGDPAFANSSAMQYADKSLEGKTPKQIRSWINDNAGWLQDAPSVNVLVDRYATKLEGSQRSLENAQEFAKQAASDNKLLVGKMLPAQRAVDLIKSGNVELWDKTIPAITQSPQAKEQMVRAIRQVIGDQASSRGTEDLFNRSIRPFVEKSGIASKDEMDFISGRLDQIKNMKVPESQKLGFARRLLLNSAAGYTSGGMSRGMLGLMQIQQ